MTYPRAHSRLTVFGDSYGVTELWQTSFRLDGTNAPNTADFEAIDGAVNTYLTGSDVAFPNGFRYLGLKWAPQDTNGRYGDEGEAIEWLRASPRGGSYGGGYPQIACVTSLRTGRSRGYASNGRMYWPSCAQPVATSGAITESQALGVATTMAALVAAINGRGLGAVSVMSSVGAGRIEHVTGIRVGRVMDTQRRRRNAIPEQYTEPIAVPT